MYLNGSQDKRRVCSSGVRRKEEEGLLTGSDYRSMTQKSCDIGVSNRFTD